MASADGEDWDPMKADSESFMNTVFEISDPGAQFFGEDCLLSKNITCPFFDPETSTTGKCFKGSNCLYYHGKYSSKVAMDLPKLSLTENNEEITIFSDLPPKELAADDCLTVAWVATTLDPSEFYIIPKEGWNCMCTSVDIMSDDNGLAYNCAGFTTFEELYTNLQNYMLQSICKQKTSYVSGQLVAVKLITAGKRKQWFRAVVLEDSILQDSGESVPDIKLRLLDYGIGCVKKVMEVVPLPKQFCHISAMAFKCRLYGISPITGYWSSRATKTFQDLIQGQFVCLEIKQTVKGIDGPFNLFERSPYLFSRDLCEI